MNSFKSLAFSFYLMPNDQLINDLYVGIVTAGREEIEFAMEALERQTKKADDVIVLQNKPRDNKLRKHVESFDCKWAAENGRSIGYARAAVESMVAVDALKNLADQANHDEKNKIDRAVNKCKSAIRTGLPELCIPYLKREKIFDTVEKMGHNICIVMLDDDSIPSKNLIGSYDKVLNQDPRAAAGKRSD